MGDSIPAGSMRTRHRVLSTVMLVMAGLIGTLVAPVPAGAQDIVTQVVWGKRADEIWKFAHSNQVGDLWDTFAQPGFDASTWADESLRFTANPGSGRANYFRREFELTELYKIQAIEVDLQYDDAAILWLNGTEVYRTIRGNLPPAPQQVAANATVPYGGAEDYYVQIPGNNTCEQGCSNVDVPAIPVDLLVEGTNVWGVSLWNRTGSSDVSLDHAFRLVIDRDALPPGPVIDDVNAQSNRLADSVSLQMSAELPNGGPVSWGATGLPDGLTINSSTGLISGQPSTIGNFAVVVTSTDPVGSNEVAFDWEVVNAPPVITDPGPQQTASFAPASLALIAEDPDGGPLMWQVDGLPDGLSFDPATAVVSGSSSAEGPYTVVVTVTDDENESAETSFAWQIAEPPITLVSPGAQSTPWGDAVSLPIDASDPAGGAVTLDVSGLPSGLSLNPANNTIVGTPDVVGAGSVVIEGTGQSGRAIVAFDWEILNLAPLVSPIPMQEALEDLGTIDIAMTGSDPDGGALTWSAEGLPAGIAIDAVTGVISGQATEDGTFTATVTATDDEGAGTAVESEWLVYPALAMPVVINEIVASNTDSLLDEDGDSPDWIELRSLAPIPIELDGWVLEDATAAWTIPPITLQPDEHRVIFASDKDRTDPAGELHTNFKLSKQFDALTLIDPDGIVIDSYPADMLPQQIADVSYGRASNGDIGYLASSTPSRANSPLGTNFPPVLRPFTDRLYNVGDVINEQIDAFDPDAGPLSFAVLGRPGWLDVGVTSGVVSGTADVPGIHETEIVVFDSSGQSVRQPVRWIVIDQAPTAARLVLNEYNAVAPDRPLIAGEDPAFGLVDGNGGDWYEFVVVEDGLDLRGWSIELWDRDRNNEFLDLASTLVFANRPQISNLASGTIITISEDLPDDLSFDPGNGDWTINLQANDLDEGAFFTAASQENFNSSRSNQNVVLYNDAGGLESPAVGETELWDELVGGVGSGEVMSLCIDPTAAQVNPVEDYLDNGTFSSFGAPNSCTFVGDPADPDDDVRFDQDLTALRAAARFALVSATATCIAGAGGIDVIVTNTGTDPSFMVSGTGLADRSISVAIGDTATESFAPRPNGDYDVVVRNDGAVIDEITVTVDCAPAAQLAAAVSHTISCLAGNGRVDTNVVNTGPDAAMIRLEFEGLSPRQSMAAAGDWWRMAITGRADGHYNVVVKADGEIISDSTVTVACDIDEPVVTTPEVQVINACRAGNGYLLFQFVNSTDSSRSWVIEFENIRNRSTTAVVDAAAIRAVTGRPDGLWDVFIRTTSGEPVASMTIEVDCD